MGRKQTLHNPKNGRWFWKRGKVGHPTKVYKRYFKGTQEDYAKLVPAKKQLYLTPTQSKDLLKEYQDRHAGRSLKSIIADESLPAKSNQTTSWTIDGIINRFDFDPLGVQIDTKNSSGDWRGLKFGKGKKEQKRYPVPKPKKKSAPKKKTSGKKRGRPKDPNALVNVLKRYPKANVNIGKRIRTRLVSASFFIWKRC